MKKKITNLFLIVFITILMINIKINAAIVYTDVNPDVTTTLNSSLGYVDDVVEIDFNGDNVEEYNFRWDDYGSGGWFMHMTFATGNEFVLKGTATNPYGGRYLQALSANTNISATDNWGNSFPEPFIGDNSDPNFQGLGDKYVGVKFKLGADTYYGWVLVSFDANKTLTVKEYAYENIPNTAILAGDKGSSSDISEIEKISFLIYPNPTRDYISIENISKSNVKLVSIYSVDSKLVFKESIDNINETIDVRKLNPGVYFMKLEMINEGFYVYKLIKD